MKFLPRAAGWSTAAAALSLAVPVAASAGVVVTAKAVRAPGGQVAFTCAATDTEPVSTITITDCYMTTGETATQFFTFPGQVAVAYGKAELSRGPFSVCVRAKATKVVGGVQEYSPLHCEGPTVDVGAG